MARTGFFTADGKPIRAQYALVDQTVEPAGRLVAEDSRKGVFLYRLDGPLRQNTLVTGLYADTWSGPRVTYLRRVCTGGWLSVALGSDASLVHAAQTVTATSAGRRASPPVFLPVSRRRFAYRSSHAAGGAPSRST